MFENEMSNEDISDLNFIKEEIEIEECYVLNGIKQEMKQEPQNVFNNNGNIDFERNLEPAKILAEQSDENNFKCDQCDKTYKNKTRLAMHKTHVHVTERPFQCEVCLKSFTTATCVRRHLRIHNEERPFKCGQCPKGFKAQTTLNQHMVHVHEKDGKFPCGICGKSFMSADILEDHVSRHSDERKHACDQCGACFKVKRDVARHKTIVHRDKSHQCEVCSKKFATLARLKNHALIHIKEKPFKCDTCPARYPAESLLKQHVALHVKIKSHNCDQCCKAFCFQYDLARHKVAEHGEPGRFPCPICGKGFMKRGALTEHLSKHTDERNVQCDQCDKKYKTTLYLARHKRYAHATEKRFQCEACPESFTMSTYLKRHSRKHKGKLHRCDLCCRVFKSQESLDHHKVQDHDKDSRLLCQLCGRTLTDPNKFKNHLEQHNRYKHVCGECGGSFRIEADLDRHKRRVHLKKSFQCGMCLKRFKGEANLEKHFKDTHRVEMVEMFDEVDVKAEPVVLYDPEVKGEAVDIKEEIKEEEIDVFIKQEPEDSGF